MRARTMKGSERGDGREQLYDSPKYQEQERKGERISGVLGSKLLPSLHHSSVCAEEPTKDGFAA